MADAVKYTVIFLRNSLQLGTYSKNAALRAALLQWCYSSRDFGANPTVTAGNVTGADDDRMQVDSLKTGKEKSKSHYQKGNRPTTTTNTSSTDINTCKNCGRHGHWAGGGAHDNSTSHSNPQKGKGHWKGKGKGKHVDVRISLLTQLQPQLPLCRIFRKHRTPLENSRAFLTCNRGSWV